MKLQKNRINKKNEDYDTKTVRKIVESAFSNSSCTEISFG
jgi:hypothetical protein